MPGPGPGPGLAEIAGAGAGAGAGVYLFFNFLKDLRGPYAQKKNLYYSFDRDENLHTYVKSKIKWGNSLEIFSIFFIANELFTENVKKGGPR